MALPVLILKSSKTWQKCPVNRRFKGTVKENERGYLFLLRRGSGVTFFESNIYLIVKIPVGNTQTHVNCTFLRFAI